MVDNPREPEQEPTEVEKAVAKADSIVRTILAGSEVGAIRRLVLYLVVSGAFISFAGHPGATVALFIGLTAVLLLAVTDVLA